MMSSALTVVETADQPAELAAIWDSIYRLAFRMLGSRFDAEDVAQETMERLLRHATRLRNPDAWRSWAFRTAVRSCWKRQRKPPWVSLSEWLSQNRATAALERDFERADQRLDLNAALNGLPPHQRTTIILHYGYDLPSAEIAKLLGRPAGTVRYWLSDARSRLQRHFSPQ